ncbi:MaoC/PaaZ C-terminal domain-containing protein [Paraglaciecola aestuariivivens]
MNTDFEQSLNSLPSISLLLAKSLFKISKIPKDGTQPCLPSTQFTLSEVQLDRALVANCHRVMQWPKNANFVHPCVLHVLAFPLHLKLLNLADCPFPLLGLVHVENSVTLLKPMKIGQKLRLQSCFSSLQAHAKGWTLVISVKVFNRRSLVYSSESTYLYRDHILASNKSLHSSQKPKILPFELLKSWPLKANLGREYAKVSKDFNPIHLYGFSARLLGFKQSIAHGMWLKAFVLSSLFEQQKLDLYEGFKAQVKFKQPVYLPNEINLSTQTPLKTSADLAFQLTTQLPDKPHLVGNIIAIS